MSGIVQITTPITREGIAELPTGTLVHINGVLYTARDAAHQRMADAMEAGEDLPFDASDQILYYVGPTPAPDGAVIGAAGPTTGYRMDSYLEVMLEAGIRATIGKGQRSPEALAAMKRHGAAYLLATGGAGTLLSRCITSCEIIAYEDLGTEAVLKIEVEEFPCVVVYGADGGDLFRMGRDDWSS